MRIRFQSDTVFNSGDRNIYQSLQRLFLRAAQGQHEVIVCDPLQVLQSDFLTEGIAPMERAEWRERLSRTLASGNFHAEPSAQRPMRYALVTESAVERTAAVTFVLSPSDVGSWAEQPLRVLLENQSDEALLIAVERLRQNPRIATFRKYGWLIYDGRGGGGEVKKTVLAEDQTKARIFCVIDSDREEPTSDESRTAREIREIFTNVFSSLSEDRDGLPLHVLERREIENYVPEAIWQLAIARDASGKKRSQRSGPKRRAILVYRWLAQQLDTHHDDLKSKYGRDAFDQVSKDIDKQIKRTFDAPLLSELLEEWRQLSTKGKAVDDLKVRFGNKIAEKAVAEFAREDFDPDWLDEDAKRELLIIAEKLEAWL